MNSCIFWFILSCVRFNKCKHTISYNKLFIFWEVLSVDPDHDIQAYFGATIMLASVVNMLYKWLSWIKGYLIEWLVDPYFICKSWNLINKHLGAKRITGNSLIQNGQMLSENALVATIGYEYVLFSYLEFYAMWITINSFFSSYKINAKN